MQSANPNGGGYRFGPPPQPASEQSQGSDPMSNMGLLPMLMASQGKSGAGGGSSGLLGLLGMNKTPSVDVSIPGLDRGQYGTGAPYQMTIAPPVPDMGSAGPGIHGLWHSLMGMFGPGAG